MAVRDTIKSLAAAVVQGEPTALNLAKTMLMNPTIVSTDPKWAISLEPETYDKSGTAEVSQHPVIVPGSGVKQFLNDNVAPSPLSWTISGYIPGNPVLEPVCIFTPVVRANTDFLWAAFKRGSRIIFKDMDQHPYENCVITNLKTSYVKDCANKMPVTITIQEIVSIDASVSEYDETAQTSAPDDKEQDAGTTGTSGYPLGNEILYKLVHGGS